MANIESKDLMVAVKSFARANPLPLDKDEIWESKSAAEAYVQGPTAYPGQTLKVLMEDGKYKTYTIQEKVDGSLFLDDLKVTVETTLEWGEF